MLQAKHLRLLLHLHPIEAWVHHVIIITIYCKSTACTEAAIAAFKGTHLFASSPPNLCVYLQGAANVLFSEAGGALTTGGVFSAASYNKTIMPQSQSLTLSANLGCSGT